MQHTAVPIPPRRPAAMPSAPSTTRPHGAPGHTVILLFRALPLPPLPPPPKPAANPAQPCTPNPRPQPLTSCVTCRSVSSTTPSSAASSRSGGASSAASCSSAVASRHSVSGASLLTSRVRRSCGGQAGRVRVHAHAGTRARTRRHARACTWFQSRIHCRSRASDRRRPVRYLLAGPCALSTSKQHFVRPPSPPAWRARARPPALRFPHACSACADSVARTCPSASSGGGGQPMLHSQLRAVGTTMQLRHISWPRHAPPPHTHTPRTPRVIHQALRALSLVVAPSRAMHHHHAA